MIETERLLLREYTMEDFDALYEIMSDAETMQHYPALFDEARTRRWIEWNLENYSKYGFGLWAVVLKETGEFIGDCGLTLQNIDGEMLPEIGYHIHKKYQRRGYAKEAARAARDWAFRNTEYNILYSYMKYTNEGSWRTAMANGMKKVKEYPDPKNTISYAFSITREEWKSLVRLTPMTDDMYYSFFSEYENDPDLFLVGQEYIHYEYSEEKVAKYIQKQKDHKRISLAIMHDDEIVGEVIIKNIEPKKCATMSIVLKNAQYKDRGFGTMAERLAVKYVFDDLDIPVLYADTIRENVRSQHVLEKVGFSLVRDDEQFKYYRIDRE